MPLTQTLANWPGNAHSSTIFLETSRKSASASKVHVKDVNARRAALMIPGSAIQPTERDARIPILLVQQPGAISFLGFVELILTRTT